MANRNSPSGQDGLRGGDSMREFVCAACGFRADDSSATWDVLQETRACPECRTPAGSSESARGATPKETQPRDRAWALRQLGVRAEATDGEVKRAYQDLVQVWHPDRFENNERLR